MKLPEIPKYEVPDLSAAKDAGTQEPAAEKTAGECMGC